MSVGSAGRVGEGGGGGVALGFEGFCVGSGVAVAGMGVAVGDGGTEVAVGEDGGVGDTVAVGAGVGDREAGFAVGEATVGTGVGCNNSSISSSSVPICSSSAAIAPLCTVAVTATPLAVVSMTLTCSVSCLFCNNSTKRRQNIALKRANRRIKRSRAPSLNLSRARPYKLVADS